ncbi:ComEA family DNA-binding protein [Nocardioides sp. zg-1230]|uniref:ComEA family DNA-binding protein n=1 Tax=Nocardioides sp. zg-1230 TaxID=2736601 RepID=UPI001551A9CE|nr:ComEA family DNA-binding protein [Nocardioides sp. zg-1230]NPC43144.1 ComEA family DNA-binding protein [Nocardioides sp. zg-1230]
MRRSQSSSEHAEAVSRRLATLSAELAAVRDEPADPAGPADPAWGHTRVRERPDAVPVPAAVPVVPPLPGRHASRRLRVGGLQLGPVHVAVVAVVAALAVGIAAWWAVRDQARAVPVAPSASGSASESGSPEQLAPVVSSDAAAPGDQGPGVTDAGEELVVDVAGKVRRPGIAVLPAGSRVVDALDAAGGARRGVDLTSLNLARPVVDGEQILVGVAPAAGVAGTVDAPAPDGATLVNLNTADQAALDTLPGVGPVTADAILAWRDANGAFTSVDELLEVDGIGEATLADLAPLVTL